MSIHRNKDFENTSAGRETLFQDSGEALAEARWGLRPDSKAFEFESEIIMLYSKAAGDPVEQTALRKETKKPGPGNKNLHYRSFVRRVLPVFSGGKANEARAVIKKRFACFLKTSRSRFFRAPVFVGCVDEI